MKFSFKLRILPESAVAVGESARDLKWERREKRGDREIVGLIERMGRIECEIEKQRERERERDRERE